MDYIELTVKYSSKLDFFGDLIVAELGEIGYDSFCQEPDEIKAYIESNLFSETTLTLLNNTNNKEFGTVSFSYIPVKTENWNAKWEEEFQPVVIGNECIVRAPFHTLDKTYKYDVIIEPKMSFGTGHHATTALMIETILEIDFEGKTAVDCGCGTGVLAIVAALRGASKVCAFDIDEWCYQNTIENIEVNKLDIDLFDVKLGGFETIAQGEQFDIVIANINRNILINSMKQIEACIAKGGTLLLSGFYETDIPQIKEAALQNNLEFVSFKEKNKWVCCRFTK